MHSQRHPPSVHQSLAEDEMPLPHILFQEVIHQLRLRSRNELLSTSSTLAEMLTFVKLGNIWTGSNKGNMSC